MANNKKLNGTKDVMVTVEGSDTNNNIVALTEGLSTSENKDFEKYDITNKAVEAFVKIDSNTFSSYRDWEDYLKKYEEVLVTIADYDQSSTSSDNQIDVTEFTVKVNYSYDRSMIVFNKWQAKNVKDIDDKISKQQITTLSVFSIFMTLLTFLLTNISKVVSGDISIKSIIVTNLILLCVASTIFLFIGVFLGVVGKNDSKRLKVLKYIVLFALPFVFLATVILFSIFFRG